MKQLSSRTSHTLRCESSYPDPKILTDSHSSSSTPDSNTRNPNLICTQLHSFVVFLKFGRLNGKEVIRTAAGYSEIGRQIESHQIVNQDSIDENSLRIMWITSLQLWNAQVLPQYYQISVKACADGAALLAAGSTIITINHRKLKEHPWRWLDGQGRVTFIYAHRNVICASIWRELVPSCMLYSHPEKPIYTPPQPATTASGPIARWASSSPVHDLTILAGYNSSLTYSLSLGTSLSPPSDPTRTRVRRPLATRAPVKTWDEMIGRAALHRVIIKADPRHPSLSIAVPAFPPPDAAFKSHRQKSPSDAPSLNRAFHFWTSPARSPRLPSDPPVPSRAPGTGRDPRHRDHCHCRSPSLSSTTSASYMESYM